MAPVEIFHLHRSSGSGSGSGSASALRRSVLPDGLKIEISSSLSTAHTPTLSLVSRAETHRTPSRLPILPFQVGGFISLCSICVGLELGNSFSFQRCFFGIRRVRNCFQAGDAGTSGPGRRWRGGDRRISCAIASGKGIVASIGGC